MGNHQPLDLIWGARAIGEACNRSERQVYHLIVTGFLPASNIGGRWCITRAKLAKALDAELEAA